MNGDIADDVQTKGQNCTVALQFESKQNFLDLSRFTTVVRWSKMTEKNGAMVVSRPI